jgi:hypothetical protein
MVDQVSPAIYYFLVHLHPDDHFDVLVLALRYMQDSSGSASIELCIKSAIRELFPSHPIN